MIMIWDRWCFAQSQRCALAAIRAMNRFEYKDALRWISRAKRWERRRPTAPPPHSPP